MPAVAARPLTLTPEEYFAWELTQQVRHEYHFGEVYPMPGGTLGHATLTANLTGALFVALRDTECRALSEAMRVEVLAGAQYVYPDVPVLCGPAEFATERPTTLTNPTVVCEVLSPETAAYDRGEKLALYRGVPSIQAVLYADPDRRWVQQVRKAGATWVRDEAVTDAPVRVEALGVTLALDDLYRGVG